MRSLTAAALRSPAAVAVGVAVAILFGAFALYSLPIQLFPDIDRPQIGIETDWRAETPREVESQLVQPEEDVLQGLRSEEHTSELQSHSDLVCRLLLEKKKKKKNKIKRAS